MTGRACGVRLRAGHAGGRRILDEQGMEAQSVVKKVVYVLETELM